MNKCVLYFCLATALLVAFASTTAGQSSCLFPSLNNNSAYNINSDMKLWQKQNELRSAFGANPDTSIWEQQRQQIKKSLGERDYDVNFSRAFDSVVLAASSLEYPVKNMERESGYLIAERVKLPQDLHNELAEQMIREWAAINGFDSSIFDEEFRSDAYKNSKSTFASLDINSMMGKYYNQKTLTFQLVKLGTDRTRIKARFSDVIYPKELQEYYELIWQTVDKQLFIDQNIDGKTVEKRN